MPLTPADVHNVAFSKPPIGKRGYNEDEVDAFLDLVETELTRLFEENSDLRQRVSELQRDVEVARSAGASAAPTETIVAVEPVVVRTAPTVESDREEQSFKAARVLAFAQETADNLVGAAQAEADQMVSDARANADRILGEARLSADTTVSESRQRADTMLSDAAFRSETQLRQAQEKADALQADAERKHAEIMGNINQQRTVLEARLEQLRTFEREYRTRLKTYLESQLEELGQRGSAAPVDAGGDAAGFDQFNRTNS